MIKVYCNANIYTADKNLLFADFLVTDYNKIVYVGNSSNISDKSFLDNYLKIANEVFDLKNKLVLPGFIDSHAHIIMGGFYLLSADLSNVKSKKEFVDVIKKYVIQNPGKPVYGGNFNQQNWDIKEFPDKSWVDDFTPDIPVFLHRMDYHSALANSFVLKLAGITKETPNPEGGEIVKDKITGEPTGMLKDKAMDLVAELLPERSEEEYFDACCATMSIAKKFGVTSIHDIAYKGDFKTYQKLLKNNKLTVRIYTRLPIEKCESIINCELENNFGNDYLKFGGLKAFADGSLGSYTALFFEPYIDDINAYGLATDIVNNGNLEKWGIYSDNNNLQLSIHAIGDKAISLILDLAEKISSLNVKRDRRLRIEHSQHINVDDLERYVKNDVISSMQPYHLFDDGCWAKSKIGEERLKTTLAFNSFINKGIKVCFGSDFPVATLNPILGIYAAVTRHTADGLNPNGIIPEEKISVLQAVNAYTIDAAYASFEENIKGSITAGKLADFVVLNKNIFEINPNEIKDVYVEKTIFDGNIIYSV
ncbi:MAG TPA: amidohydrolase [Melioribacteraceae bacterium]|nr:amidohydrolase [Melioribacteraceae bacterium]